MKKESEAKEIHHVGALGGVPMTQDGALHMIDDCIRDIFRNYITIGRAANFLKDNMGHGQFKSTIKERYAGIVSYETVARSMAVAEFADANPKIASSLDFTGLRKTVQLMLAKSNITDEDLSEEDGMIAGVSINDLKAGKIKSLKRELDQTKLENAEMAEQLDKGREQLKELSDKLDYERNRNTWLDRNDKEIFHRLDDRAVVMMGIVHDLSEFKADQASAPARARFFSVMNFMDQLLTETINRKRQECDGIEFETPAYEPPSMEDFLRG